MLSQGAKRLIASRCSTRSSTQAKIDIRVVESAPTARAVDANVMSKGPDFVVF